MSKCVNCGVKFYAPEGKSHTICELCTENKYLAKEIKELICKVEYVKNQYELNFNEALEIIKVHTIIDKLEKMCYSMDHIREL